MAGSSFLSLAYMIEISVVLNLAYRELKFPDLHKKVEKRVNTILNNARKVDIPSKENYDNTYPEFDKIKAFIEIDKKKEWGEETLENFYIEYIIERQSLHIVNWFILCNVFLLIVVTALSSLDFRSPLYWSDFNNLFGLILGLGIGYFVLKITEKFMKNPLKNFSVQAVAILVICLLYFSVLPFSIEPVQAGESVVEYYVNIFAPIAWWIFFGMLILFTVTPLLFIRFATKCEELLLGEEEEYNLHKMEEFKLINKSVVSGKINKLAYEMFARYHELNEKNTPKPGN